MLTRLGVNLRSTNDDDDDVSRRECGNVTM